MKIIAKYIHGSHDSNDIDIFYVVDKIDSFQEAKIFCDSSHNENRNIIVIENGIVVDCYKGTCDEIQNSLLTTYHLHKQEYSLLIKDKVDRDVELKAIRVVRCILSHCSRTHYRPFIKNALSSNDFNFRLLTLKTIDFNTIDNYIKNTNVEVFKVFAFQLAQILGLHRDIEIYTKSDAVKLFPSLEKYLYREEYANPADLISYIDLFIFELNRYTNINNSFDIKKEKRLSNECYT